MAARLGARQGGGKRPLAMVWIDEHRAIAIARVLGTGGTRRVSRPRVTSRRRSVTDSFRGWRKRKRRGAGDDAKSARGESNEGRLTCPPGW